MATRALPAVGYGLRYEYGIFKQVIEDGWQREQPDNWLRRPDPWEVPRPEEQVEVTLGCSFQVRGGTLGVIAHRPSRLIGLPFDRPVVGYGGKTINTLRLWAAGAPDRVRLPRLQRRGVRERAGRAARRRIPDARPLSRRLHQPGAGAALRAGVLPRRLLAGRSGAALPPEQRRVERAPRQGRDPAQRYPPRPGRARADAHPAGRGGPRVGRGLESQPADARVHEPHAPAGGAREMAARLVRGAAAAPPRDRLRDRSPAPRRCGRPLPGRRRAAWSA